MKQLVTFTPENRYFFGYTYSYEDSYLIKSRAVPPLSTILGTIRKAILDQNDILKISDYRGKIVEKANNTKEIIDAIGDFDYNTNPNGDLGLIKSISPVFLVRKSDKKFFYPIPLNWQKEENKIVSRAIVKKENKIVSRAIVKKENILNNFNGSASKFFFNIKSYNSKSDLMEIWVNTNIWQDLATLESKILESGADVLYPEKIFISQIHPGINRGIKQDDDRRKSVTQSSEEQNYFIKEDYSIKDNAYCFGVILDFDDNNLALRNSGVFMGGDRSFFFMEVDNNVQIDATNFMSHFLEPKNTLDKDKVYIVLSETNLENLADGKLTSFNAGYLNLQRGMVLPRNPLTNNSSELPFRLKMKGAVRRSLPIGSILLINEEIKLTQKYNPQAGFDRYYLL